MSDTSAIIYRINPTVTNEALNGLFAVAWEGHQWRDFQPILQRSLAYVGAYDDERLVGFVNIAWDGRIYAFILDTTVRPEMRRRGIGRELVRQAITVARGRGIEWLHVDFEPHLREFYEECGFRHTDAGLLRLNVT